MRRPHVAWVVGFFLLGAAIKYRGMAEAPPPQSELYWEGEEFQAILLASPTCKVCRSTEFREIMASSLADLSERNWGAERHFSKVFVGLGHDVDEALELAESISDFDELIVGHGWLNVGAIHYLWEDLPSEAATPNLAITKRRIEYDENTGRLLPANEELHIRLIGLGEIRRWAANGALVPGI